MDPKKFHQGCGFEKFAVWLAIWFPYVSLLLLYLKKGSCCFRLLVSIPTYLCSWQFFFLPAFLRVSRKIQSTPTLVIPLLAKNSSGSSGNSSTNRDVYQILMSSISTTACQDSSLVARGISRSRATTVVGTQCRLLGGGEVCKFDEGWLEEPESPVHSSTPNVCAKTIQDMISRCIYYKNIVRL